jgi:hypothetical protein
MNTGAYHYRQAEAYLAGAVALRAREHHGEAELLLTFAQVHAELAAVEPLQPPVRLDDIDTSDIKVKPERRGMRDDLLVAGSGPEECVADVSANPNWLRNHARNALALARELEARSAKP